MSTYRKIHGRSIQAVTTDPTESVAEGQVWYNTTSDTFKSVLINEAWVSATPMSTFRYGTAGGGTQSAAFVGGGYPTPSPDPTNVTEEYNGSGWSSGGNMNTARMYIGGSGTQTAGLASGGDEYPSPRYSVLVEEYDGSSWTVQNTLPTQNKNMGSCGTQTASLNIGGSVPAATNVTNSYDGTNWTNTGHNLNTARFSLRAVGTTTSALVNGGNPNLQTTEEYDGSSWTSASNSVSNFDAHSSAGTQTAARMFGGFPSPSVQHNFYDGSSWSTAPNLGTGRYYGALGPIGTSTAALMAGGNASPSPVTGVATEEFTSSANVITAAAWSSGSLMGTGRYQGNGQNVGTQTAGMYSGGQGSYPSTNPAVTVSNVEEYDGSSWSEVNNLPESKAMFGAVGTQTAAFVFGGYGGPGAGPNPGPGGSPKSAALNYDGTNWTASPYSLPSAVAYLTGAGTSTAALSIGGHPALTTCNEYDGEGWTSTGSMTTGRNNSSAFGTQTAAIVAGGAPGAAVAEDVESYNGTSWTAASDLIQPKGQAGTAGTQTDGLIFLGNEPSPTTTLGWNGTSWFTQPSTSTARYGGSNGSTTTASAYYAGGGGSASGTTRQTTEEFTAESSAVNVKTLTQS